MSTRIFILSACLLLGAAYVARASKTEVVPSRQPLSLFPYDIGGWNGQKAEDFPPDVLEVLGVDEYINRVYQSNRRYAGLYVGYYQSQRQGDTIHSPLNCLPGSGWEPVSKSYVDIPVQSPAGETVVTVNRYVVQKGLDRQVVLYWYHSHGRVVANEYRSKIFMVYDAVRLNRTDAALVRVISPRLGQDQDAEIRAEETAVEFVKVVFPLLGKYIPS